MSNGKKIVKRKYFSKKLNKYIVKEYVYEAAKYKRPSKLKKEAIKSKPVTYVFKSGKYTKAYKKEWERIKQEKGILAAQAFEQIVTTLRHTDRIKKITSLSVQSVQTKYRIETFLNNLGSSIDDFTLEVSAMTNEDIETSYVLTDSNWIFKGLKGNAQFRLPSGSFVEIDYEYPAGLVIKYDKEG